MFIHVIVPPFVYHASKHHRDTSAPMPTWFAVVFIAIVIAGIAYAWWNDRKYRY